MLKRMLMILVLALQFVAVADLATADPPFPECLPCPAVR